MSDGIQGIGIGQVGLPHLVVFLSHHQGKEQVGHLLGDVLHVVEQGTFGRFVFDRFDALVPPVLVVTEQRLVVPDAERGGGKLLLVRVAIVSVKGQVALDVKRTAQRPDVLLDAQPEGRRNVLLRTVFVGIGIRIVPQHEILVVTDRGRSQVELRQVLRLVGAVLPIGGQIRMPRPERGQGTIRSQRDGLPKGKLTGSFGGLLLSLHRERTNSQQKDDSYPGDGKTMLSHKSVAFSMLLPEMRAASASFSLRSPLL